MLSLYRRPSALRTRFALRAFLRVENLEGRATPSGDVMPPLSGSSVTSTNQAPQIVDFAAQELGNGLFIFTGRVLDESPGGLTVTFGGGVPTMVGRSCVTDSNGNFSFMIQLQTNGTDIGWVTAKTQDSHGVASNEPSVHVRPTP